MLMALKLDTELGLGLLAVRVFDLEQDPLGAPRRRWGLEPPVATLVVDLTRLRVLRTLSIEDGEARGGVSQIDTYRRAPVHRYRAPRWNRDPMRRRTDDRLSVRLRPAVRAALRVI